MKILREDSRPGGLRVVEKIAWFPKKIHTTCRPDSWVSFGDKYYVLQRLQFHKLYWFDEEYSINSYEWDFKWSEEYLNNWK